MNKDLLPKINKKGTPPPAGEPESDNLRKEPGTTKTQVNFQTTSAKKKEMDEYALSKDLYLHEVLVKAFDDYKSRNE